MECIYEETSSCADGQKGQNIGKAANVVFWISLAFAIVCLISSVTFLPFDAPIEGASEEEVSAYRFSCFLLVISVAFSVFFSLIAVLTFLFKLRNGVSYDYVFVSGELRIAKIFGANRRKHILCLQREHILQIGDVNSAGYALLEREPNVKTVVLTPNIAPTKGKFFMYIYADDGMGKKLLVLECKKELFMHILRSVGRDRVAIENEYDLFG